MSTNTTSNTTSSSITSIQISPSVHRRLISLSSSSFGIFFGSIDENAGKIFILEIIEIGQKPINSETISFQSSEIDRLTIGGIFSLGIFSRFSVDSAEAAAAIAKFHSKKNQKIFIAPTSENSTEYRGELFTGPRRSLVRSKILPVKIQNFLDSPENFHEFQLNFPLNKNIFINFQSISIDSLHLFLNNSIIEPWSSVLNSSIYSIENEFSCFQTGAGTGTGTGTGASTGNEIKNISIENYFNKYSSKNGNINHKKLNQINKNIHQVDIFIMKNNLLNSNEEIKTNENLLNSSYLLHFNGFISGRAIVYSKCSLLHALELLKQDAIQSLKNRIDFFIEELEISHGSNIEIQKISKELFQLQRRIFYSPKYDSSSSSSPFTICEYLNVNEKVDDAAARIREEFHFDCKSEEIEETEIISKIQMKENVNEKSNISKNENEKEKNSTKLSDQKIGGLNSSEQKSSGFSLFQLSILIVLLSIGLAIGLGIATS